MKSLFSLEAEFPSLSPFYFSWEKSFDPISVLFFSRRYYWLTPCAAALYLLFIYIGPRIMASRPAYDLRTPLRYWNLFLAIFSFWGTARIVPHLVLMIAKTGFSATLCIPPVWTFGSGAAGLWTVFFVYSKYLELIDTVFIVLRKRKLSFLHWYHHATVLLFTWDAFVVEQPPGIYFCAMNYTVHAIMYFYYYLAAAMKKPPKWGMIVTGLQIAQMFAGVFLTLISLCYAYAYPFLWHTTAENALRPFDAPGCYVDRRNLIGSIAMYSTYLYLFAAFFWERYITAPVALPLKAKKVA